MWCRVNVPSYVRKVWLYWIQGSGLDSWDCKCGHHLRGLCCAPFSRSDHWTLQHNNVVEYYSKGLVYQCDYPVRTKFIYAKEEKNSQWWKLGIRMFIFSKLFKFRFHFPVLFLHPNPTFSYKLFHRWTITRTLVYIPSLLNWYLENLFCTFWADTKVGFVHFYIHQSMSWKIT